MASNFGCNPSSFPFLYLGIPVGARMTKINSWRPIVEKFHKRLSRWNASLLSIGGRATLVTSVLGALGNYYCSLFKMPRKVIDCLESIRMNFFWGGNKDNHKMAWVNWKMVLASKAVGGLGIGSLEALNLALIYKWRWRALTYPEAPWVKIVNAIHGQNVLVDFNCKGSSPWARLCATFKRVHESHNIPNNVIKKRIWDGSSTSFWHDSWREGELLKVRFPRLYALENDKHCSIANRYTRSGWAWSWRRGIRAGRDQEEFDILSNELREVQLETGEDEWVWNFRGDKFFKVSSLRHALDYNILPFELHPTVWNPLLPKKVNIFIWRLMRDRLPSRLNLVLRGIPNISIICPVCCLGLDSVDHTFRSCKISCESRTLLAQWLQLELPDYGPDELLNWVDTRHYLPKYRKIIQGILSVWWWCLWKNRNQVIFSSDRDNSKTIFLSVVSISFLWFSSRCNKLSFSWPLWHLSPSYLM